MGVDTAHHAARAGAASPDNQSAHSRVPSEDELTSLFEAAMKRSAATADSNGNGNASTMGDAKAPAMTADEQQKFLKAMQDAEFRSLLNDYMQEISDPANRAETEQYLAQLEREQKVPDDKLLIKPTPGFVVKTKWLSSQKVFVNICSSDKLQPPSSTKVANTGTSWSLPYSLGPERLEKDKSGGGVTTFDACFHPRTLQFATLQKPYRDMVVSTCLDAIEPLLRKAHKQPSGTLSRDYHVLKGVLYKSGEPVTMCLTKPKETVEAVEEMGEMEKTTPLAPKKVETLEPRKSVEATTISHTKREATEDRRAMAKPLLQEVSSVALKTENSVQNTLPKLTFRVIYRGRFEMLDHMQASLSSQTDLPNRPKELVVEIDFPTFTSAKGIDLDVNDRAIQVTASGYAPLDVALPFAVVEAKGSAKFDKKTRRLVVTLPVQPPAPVEAKRMVIEEHEEQDQSETEQVVEMDDEPETNQTAKEIEPELTPSPLQQRQPHESVPTEQDDLFARLRETALMVAHDPLYQPRTSLSPSITTAEIPQPEEATPVPATQELSLDETMRELMAKDATYDDLPPLESCSEDELDEQERDLLDSLQLPSSSSGGSTVTPPAIVPRQTPSFTVKETALCRSYLVEVAGVDPSSVELLFPSLFSFTLRFATSSTTPFELQVDTRPVEIDTTRSECHTASENVVVILYKKSSPAIEELLLPPMAPPPVVRFQNDLLYELD